MALRDTPGTNLWSDISLNLFRESKLAKYFSDSGTIKGKLKMLENTTPIWEDEIAKKYKKKGQIEGLFSVIKITYGLNSVPENIKKMAARTFKRIGLDKSFSLIFSSPTLDEYATKISSEQDSASQGKMKDKKRSSPHP